MMDRQADAWRRPEATTRLVVPRRDRVLIVDDLPANRELLRGLLEDLGHEVREASNAQEALQAVASAEPDLIFLDISMPDLDGLAVCHQLKADPRLRLIPVVLLTAMEDRATRLMGIEAGADDFLTTPFNAEELMVRTRVLLRDRRLNLELDGAGAVILTLARIVEARDLYTVHHAERVGRYSRAIGEAYAWMQLKIWRRCTTEGCCTTSARSSFPRTSCSKMDPSPRPSGRSCAATPSSGSGCASHFAAPPCTCR